MNKFDLLNELLNHADSDEILHNMSYKIKKPKIEEFKERFNLETTDDLDTFLDKPEEVVFGFDQSCNLKCPSCRKEQIPNDANYYIRIIGHASKYITQEQANDLINNNDIEKHLNKFECPSIYSFRDYIVPDLKLTITNLNKPVTMLTGDKLSSAIQVGIVTGIIDKYKIINTK